jgi:hypothetical protein
MDNKVAPQILLLHGRTKRMDFSAYFFIGYAEIDELFAKVADGLTPVRISSGLIA